MKRQEKSSQAERSGKAYTHLIEIIKTLRSPEGCPWDRKQTVQSLAPQLIEEVYELIDGIKNSDLENSREEIGDVMLVVSMIAQVFEENGSFETEEAIEEVCEKLIRRHPHVFDDETVKNADEVVELWNSVKENVEGKKRDSSLLSSVKRSFPPLERAYKLQKKASKAGFDWNNSEDVLKKIQEEMAELEEARENANNGSSSDAIEQEFGDLLFSVINYGRFLKIDPAIALHRCNEKFIQRFTHVEEQMAAQGKTMGKEEMDSMEALWQEAKQK